VPILIEAPSAVITLRTPETLPILAIWAALSPFGATSRRSGRMICCCAAGLLAAGLAAGRGRTGG
jgi:hypothetical protein